MITLSMIVKNEQDLIEKCLESIYPFVNEIVIVDTGSTDRTKEIAQKYTNKVYDFQWSDDFSEARNFSVSKASNDWIFILDADEIVQNFNMKQIMSHIKNCPEVIGRIKIESILDDGIYKKSIERVSRLFNRKYYHYKGIIHEQIVSINDNSIASEDLDIIVFHYGYIKKIIQSKNKISRNIRLLNAAIANEKGEPYLLYQLGKAYYLDKDYVHALQYFKDSIHFVTNYNLEYVEDLIESTGYALLNSQQYTQALKIADYENLYKTSPDYNFLMGLIYMNNAKFNMAIDSFLKCTRSKEGRIEGITSYLPYYNIAVIHECLNQDNKCYAKEYYIKCGNFKPALERISEIKHNESRLQKWTITKR